MDLTSALAMYGAVVGTASIVVAGLSWRAQVKAARAEEPALQAAYGVSSGTLTLEALNTGRGDVTIDQILINGGDYHKRLTGPELPFRMAGKSSQTWRFGVPSAEWVYSAGVVAGDQILDAARRINYMGMRRRFALFRWRGRSSRIRRRDPL